MLIDYYPRIVRQIREMKEICNAEQPEFDQIIKAMDKLELNRFISTVDENNIVRIEKELGIIPMPSQSLEERRISVLIRSIKKNLSFKEIENIINKYSEDIKLIADYDKDELQVLVGEFVDNLPEIYKSLDKIIALNVFIFFICEFIVKQKIEVNLKGFRLKSKIIWPEREGKHTIKLATKIFTEGHFNTPVVNKCKDLCYLDGSEYLNGSRILDAEIIKEEL